MISFAIDGILGFSVAPLRFILGLGLRDLGAEHRRGESSRSSSSSAGSASRRPGMGLADRAGHLPRRHAADRPWDDRALRRPRLRAGQAPARSTWSRAREGLDAGPSGPLRRTPRTAPRAAASRVGRSTRRSSGEARGEELDVAAARAAQARRRAAGRAASRRVSSSASRSNSQPRTALRVSGFSGLCSKSAISPPGRQTRAISRPGPGALPPRHVVEHADREADVEGARPRTGSARPSA